MKKLILIIIAALAISCTTVTKQETSPLVVNVDPLIFHFKDIKQVDVLNITGANAVVGGIENGLIISKGEPSVLLADGPAKLGVNNYEFLKLTLDNENDDEIITKYRKAMAISETQEKLVIEKNDWLFLLLNAEFGATAYAVSENDERLFLLTHMAGFEALKETINNITFMY